MGQYYFDRFHPNFEGEYPGGGQRPSTSREDMRLDGNLEYPNATKSLYFYKHPCLLQDSNPGLMAPQIQWQYSQGKYLKVFTPSTAIKHNNQCLIIQKIPDGSELANMAANDAKMVVEVAKLAAKNDANLALLPRFCQVLIESPL
ncbi:hypothetical protein TNCV_4887761 [Trichonephila clavipes]|nr:hypothetical protein TNCV_4887761 [Trichonephila clavipes]